MKTNNKLIAEFMGFDEFEAGRFMSADILTPQENINGITLDEMKFHESWDWLIPVVKKIEENHFVKIVGKHCSINQAKTSEFNNWIATVGMTFAPCETKIEAVYKAVVIFIKWYNEHNT